MNLKDQQHLQWIYNRMVEVHNENPDSDYMVKFRNILKDFDEAGKTAEEILNKHLKIHGGDSLAITNGNVYKAVISAIDEALHIHDVTQSDCEHKHR